MYMRSAVCTLSNLSSAAPIRKMFKTDGSAESELTSMVVRTGSVFKSNDDKMVVNLGSKMDCRAELPPSWSGPLIVVSSVNEIDVSVASLFRIRFGKIVTRHSPEIISHVTPVDKHVRPIAVRLGESDAPTEKHCWALAVREMHSKAKRNTRILISDDST